MINKVQQITCVIVIIIIIIIMQWHILHMCSAGDGNKLGPIPKICFIISLTSYKNFAIFKAPVTLVLCFVSYSTNFVSVAADVDALSCRTQYQLRL
jgi:hypothetical protein